MSFQNIKTIAVIGAGTMGQGIAQVCAAAGYQVLLYDVQAHVVNQSIALISKGLQTLVEKQKITKEAKDSILKNITSVSKFEALIADLVIEAVVEKLEVKQKLFKELEAINGDTAILTSNTSSIPITQIASALKHPERFAGLHFFNPAPIMKLVEVIKGVSTNPDTIETLFQLANKLSKEPVLAHDSPGFIVNRVARHYYVESLKLAEESVLDFKSIDILMKSVGFRMGPFELMDLIGVDVNFSVTSSMYSSFHQDPKFRPSRIQQQKVEAGHHGRKSGRGFYDHSKDK